MGSKKSIYAQNEQGRSMVEIIGVLVVIGVLSVGAIAGYSYGMDKYRANEAINDVTIRGVDIVSRTQNAQEIHEDELSRDWENNETIYPTTFFYEEDYDRFGIQITGVSSNVCRLIGDSIAEHIETRVMVEGEEHEIGEHIEECNLSNDNIMHFFFEPRKCIPECFENETCIDGRCYGVECNSPRDCNPGYTGTECSVCQNGRCVINFQVEGADCTFEDDGAAGQCNLGTCIERGCTYDSNPCTEGSYCASPNTSEREAFPNGETGACVVPRFDRYNIVVNGVAETWFLSEDTLSYWDAVAACDARGLTMFPVTHWINGWGAVAEGNYTRNERALALNTTADGDIWSQWPSIWTTTQHGDDSVYWVDLTTNNGAGVDGKNVSFAGRNESRYYTAACSEFDGSTVQCAYETYEKDPCPNGFYCKSPNGSHAVAFSDAQTGSCVRPQFNERIITVDGETERWFISTTPLSWWDATAACAANNLTMVSANDLVVGWNGGIGNFEFTSRANELLRQDRVNVWTPSERGNNTSAYFVDLADNYSTSVDSWTRGSVMFYALCRK
ncbi:MAG: hypothetical protein IKV03_05160 [Alphaproteobacteria bacterium]|nr:hypothetical protein [Alphaproteobacteria bacterium]